MADRYWVGGTAAWDATAGTKWASTDGGAGGQAVPTSADDVYFTSASGVVTVTVAITNAVCKNFVCIGFTGTFSLPTPQGLSIFGNFLLAPDMTFTQTGRLAFSGTLSNTITTAGKSFGSGTVFIGDDSSSTGSWTLQDAFTSTSILNISRGTFTTNNFNVTATALSSNTTNTRTINLGSSTVTLSSPSSPVNFTTTTGLTFNAGTSQIVCTGGGIAFAGGDRTFYNVSFTSIIISTASITGANSFNNLSVAGKASAGVSSLSLAGDQTVTGTLTLSAGTNATCRTFVRSDTIGTTRTLTCAAVASLTDIDFRDITIAGAAAPVSGTRLSDCKGNSGIAFPSAKTVSFIPRSSFVWGGDNWGTSLVDFPLAQDTAVFNVTWPMPGNTVTINAAYNIGTIDMSARTSNAMTLATGSIQPVIYGNWINGTGTTLTGTGTMTFAGRGSQTITSAGKTFTQAFSIQSPGGSVTLQDAFFTNRATPAALVLSSGTFDANGYNVTAQGFDTNANAARTVNIGAGTWTLTGTIPWNASVSSGLTVTGTGTILLTSASTKTFQGGGIQTYPTISQGGTGTLTINASNKFADITNTAIGSVLFIGGTTNEFTSFSLNGTSTAARLTLGSTTTTQATLKKPSAWNVGAGSLDSGNNTGLSFTAGTVDFLNISYIAGVNTALSSSTIYYGSTNVTVLYYGSTPVTSMYYGSTRVF